MFRCCFYPEVRFYTDPLNSIAIKNLRDMSHKLKDHGISLAVASFAVPDPGTLSSSECRFYENSFHIFGENRESMVELRRLIAEYNRLVREFCTREELLYIPVAEHLTGSVETFADVCHLRIPGIKKKAEIMFEPVKDFVGKRLKTSDETNGTL